MSNAFVLNKHTSFAEMWLLERPLGVTISVKVLACFEASAKDLLLISITSSDVSFPTYVVDTCALVKKIVIGRLDNCGFTEIK